MGKENKTSDPGPPVNPERKWIRLQGFGLALLLTIPFVPLLAMLTTGATLSWVSIPESTLGMPLVAILLLAGGGIACLEIGEGKRRELRGDKEEP